MIWRSHVILNHTGFESKSCRFVLPKYRQFLSKNHNGINMGFASKISYESIKNLLNSPLYCWLIQQILATATYFLLVSTRSWFDVRRIHRSHLDDAGSLVVESSLLHHVTHIGDGNDDGNICHRQKHNHWSWYHSVERGNFGR